MAKQKINAHLTDIWPGLKGKRWPTELGAQPTLEAVKVALTVARSNTAVGMALAMYARAAGATDSMAATAASLATGSTSATHRVKRDQLSVAGMLVKATVGHDSGHQVTQISLPKAKATKATKATTKGKGKGKATKGKAKVQSAPAATVTPPAATPAAK